MMAQTLNPRASVFCPTFPEERHLDFDYLLPNSLLISPKGRGRGNNSFRSFEPVPFCRSPVGHYNDFRFSEFPQKGEKPQYENLWDLDSSKHGSVWDDFSPSVLQQEFLKMERERDIAYGRIMPAQKQPSQPKRRDPRLSSLPPQKNNTEYAKNYHRQQQPQPQLRSSPQQRPLMAAPQRNNMHQAAMQAAREANANYSSVVQRQTPPQQQVSMKPVSGQNLPGYDVECLLHLVRSQLEFYFSDQNLFEEVHSNLQYYMKLDSKRWVPVHVLLDLPAVKKLTSETEVVLKALRSSTLLELNEGETKCRRPNYIPPSDYKVRKNLRRSVLIYGLPEQMTDESLRRLLDMHGNILCVAFANMDEGPDAEIGHVIMSKKFNEMNIESLKTAFVVFESQSQANKCVKARSRHSMDGIRTMHKYDYNKVVKRLGKGQSPLFTPVAAPNMPLSQLQNQGSNHHGMNHQQQPQNNKYHSPLMSKNNFNLNNQQHPPLSNSQQQAPIFMKRNQQNQMNNNKNNNHLNNSNQSFIRNQNSHQKWRSPMKGSGSPNWRANNSPMRQRSNSTQNRSVSNSNNGEFSKVRFSKENLNAYSVLNSRSCI